MQWDALTKNGVRIWLPSRHEWCEVTVFGYLCPLQQFGGGSKHCRPVQGPSGERATLEDGCIIDLSGVQLQYAQHLNTVSCRPSVVCIASRLESLNVQCPVHLHPLYFNQTSSRNEASTPHVYPSCGHVFGYLEDSLCPLCRTPGTLRPLALVEDTTITDESSQVPECVFNPCAHAISLQTAKHYAQLRMPNGQSICPYCGVYLMCDKPYSKLYFYTENSKGQEAD